MSGSTNTTSKFSLRQKIRQTLSSKQPATQTSSVALRPAAIPHASVPVQNNASLTAVLPSSAGTSIPTSQQQQQQQQQHSTSYGQPILAQALQLLSQQDCATLQQYSSSTSVDIHDAIQQAIAAATNQRRICLDKRWSCTIAGRQVVLREEADKVIHWLDRFKSVGDVASNADPIHVGLPWAGIRFLLTAAMAESNQMAALLVGCEAALYMASRLKAYTDFFHQLPASLPRNNLEESIVIMYAHVLHFLAQAIKVYQTPTARRVLTAMWETADIVGFETNGNEIANKIERDANSCSRLASVQDRRLLPQLQQGLQDALTGMQQIRQLQASLDRLHLKTDLGKIPCARGAMFNSIDGIHTLCHPATRVDLLAQVQQWAQQPDGKSIFWLHGAAGAGKSTISWTFAQRLSEQSISDVGLGASFFFKRGEGDRGSAARFFPTIIRQLVSKVPGLDIFVAQAIDSDTEIFDKTLAEQFRVLVLQPLQATSTGLTTRSTLVVVVDALDECENGSDIRTIFKLWSQLAQITSIRLRLFLTSRPDLPIQLGFKKMSTDLYQDIVLQDAVPLNTVEHDLLVYLQDAFSIIRDEYNDQSILGPALDDSWPGISTLQSLTAMAVPLFIVAATIYRFVIDLEFDPVERLNEVLAHQNTGQMAQMDKTYLPVLNHLMLPERDDTETRILCEEFRTVVGSIICLAEPLSIINLSALLDKSIQSIERRLLPLHSVLRVPHDQYSPVRTMHLSFVEFLLGEKNQRRPFGINGPVTHQHLLDCCLRLLSSRPNGLRENICDLTSPGTFRREVESAVIEGKFSSTLQYASRYWVHHCVRSTINVMDDGNIHTFLKEHFLHWLEALSFMGQLSEAITLLDVLQSATSKTDSVQLSLFIEDARRFVLANRYIISLAPLQLYSSAIIFAPQNSLTRNLCGSIPEWIQQHPDTIPTWSLEPQKLEGHSEEVDAVAFSPDGLLLAGASREQTVRLWEVKTGQELQHFGESSEEEEPIYAPTAVAFSPDGSLLAAALCDHIRLWEIETGQEIRQIRSQTEILRCIAFSPDGSLLASALGNKVRLWEVRTGKEVLQLVGHSSQVATLDFSPDGLLLASASRGLAVRLWEAKTGQELRQFGKCSEEKGLERLTAAIAFSPDGSLLAAASWSPIRLWDIATNQKVQQLGEEFHNFADIAFSPDGSLLASASGDKVDLWEVRTGQVVQQLEGHSYWIKAVVFSPDGSLLASASVDRTVRLWEVRTGQEMQHYREHGRGWGISTVALSSDGLLSALAYGPFIQLLEAKTGRGVQQLEDHGLVREVAFSPDGSLFASSMDNTVQLWEVKTARKVKRFVYQDDVWELWFENDGLTLATDQGSIDVGNWSERVSSAKSSLSPFKVNYEWIEYNGQKLLWLPRDYRGISAVSGEKIAIGTNLGRFLYFHLTHPEQVLSR